MNKIFSVALFIILLLLPLTLNILGIKYPAQGIIENDIHSKVHPNGCGPTCLWIGKSEEPYTGEVTFAHLEDNSKSKVSIFDINQTTGKKYTWREAIAYNNPLKIKDKKAFQLGFVPFDYIINKRWIYADGDNSQ
jgi:hypothetical protein